MPQMDQLATAASEMLGLHITQQQQRAFEVYAAELIDWNKRANLTAMIDPQAIRTRHFLDSLTCLSILAPANGQAPPHVIDVGSGAGFPGLPIKLIYPELRLTLLEATRKKVMFLEHIVTRLGLENVTIINARAEEVGQHPDHRERYDWVLARAVAKMRILAEYLLPLCRIGGHCLAQKGEAAAKEVAEAQSAIKLLGGEVAQLKPIELPTVAETRYLVDIRKVAATPPAYPRRPGRPAKRPL